MPYKTICIQQIVLYRINLVYQAHHQNQIVRSAIALNRRYSQGAGIEEKETLAQEQISFLRYELWLCQVHS